MICAGSALGTGIHQLKIKITSSLGLTFKFQESDNKKVTFKVNYMVYQKKYNGQPLNKAERQLY